MKRILFTLFAFTTAFMLGAGNAELVQSRIEGLKSEIESIKAYLDRCEGELNVSEVFLGYAPKNTEANGIETDMFVKQARLTRITEELKKLQG